MKHKVAVGLSGGVDSSVAAALLLERDYKVTGVYITCWSGPGCRDEADKKDALDVALQLGIPFVHLDFRKEYREKVYEYMMAEYAKGRTPNPDVMCNREIKFGLFYEWSQTNGYDYVATGHYAQTDGKHLIQSKDKHKDQTYFLWQLEQKQLARILFPIGHLTKDEVRREAEKRKLLTAKKPDSQGICFIGEVGVSKFLAERIEKKPGKILFEGTEVGRHNGVWFYTIGQKIAIDQRKIQGFDRTNLPHFYVMKKDVEQNVVYVGTREQLFTDKLTVSEIHWIVEQVPEKVRIRHGGELVKIKKFQKVNETYQLELEEPVWGVAAGQSVVFYREEMVCGGGVISG